MKTQRFTLRAAVYLLLVKDGQVLLLRRYNTGWSDGLYGLVSGHIEGSESATAALCREAKEEAGIVLNPDYIEFVHAMHRLDSLDSDEYIDFFFTASKWQGEPYNAEPKKCDELKWYPLQKLPGNTIPYIKQVIEDYKKRVYFSEVGWDS